MVGIIDKYLKNDAEIAQMREAGRLNAQVLAEVKAMIEPGITTEELDLFAESYLRDHGAMPTFKGYPGPYPYPATLTVSINEEMVHGIPSGRKLQEGDIISVDCGTTLNGFVGDSAFTVGVGEISDDKKRLIRVACKALELAVDQMIAGNNVGDVSAAIQRYVEKYGYHVPRKYTGHGVGWEMHEPPQVPNFGTPGKGIKLQPGMTIAIEPMVLVGTARTKILADKWTVTSEDNSLTAHTEHSVAITSRGPLILTEL